MENPLFNIRFSSFKRNLLNGWLPEGISKRSVSNPYWFGNSVVYY
jgi:hypothetical protein